MNKHREDPALGACADIKLPYNPGFTALGDRVVLQDASETIAEAPGRVEDIPGQIE